MKKVLFLSFLFFTVILGQAQQVKTDLEISNELIKKEVPSLQEALNDMGLTFQIIKSRGHKTDLFIEGSKNNMKKWEIQTKKGKNRSLKKIVSVKVEYHMDNGGDFFDLRRYGYPPKKTYINDRKVKYKKSEGRKLSTLEITAD